MSFEKRQLEDRRKNPTRPLSKYSFIGKRKENRRSKDGMNYYVDRYESKYLVLVIFILILCVLDALLTLKLLQYGGEELNPFMAVLIEKDALLFLISKISITAINLIILLVHKNFHVFGSFKLRYVIYSIFFLYFLLILYEIYLFLKHIF